MFRIKYFSIFLISLLLGGASIPNDVYSQGYESSQKQTANLGTTSIVAGRIDTGYIKVNVTTRTIHNCEMFYLTANKDFSNDTQVRKIEPPVVTCTAYDVKSQIINTNTPIMGKNYSTEYYIGLIKFDVSNIPKDAVIESVMVNNMDYGETGTVGSPRKNLIGTPYKAWSSINNENYTQYNNFTYDSHLSNSFKPFKDWKSTVQDWLITGVNNGVAVGYSAFGSRDPAQIKDTYDWSNASLTITYSIGQDKTPPSPPGNLSYLNATSSSLDLNWNASTDDNIVAGYDIYRDSTLLGATRFTSYNVNNLEPDTEYKFTVRAKDQAGNQSAPSVIVAKTKALPLLSYIDFPGNGAVKGVINVAGWALDGYGISKIEIYIDGINMGQAIYGDPREDVYNVYKKYNNHNAGFHLSLDTKKLKDGKHSISIISTDKNNVRSTGNQKDFIVENALKNNYYYDGNGRITKIELPSGKTILFMYDNNGNLIKKY